MKLIPVVSWKGMVESGLTRKSYPFIHQLTVIQRNRVLVPALLILWCLVAVEV